MLVLTRRVGDEVYIDPDIIVTVVSVQGNKVRLGFEAPPHVRVRRPEIPPLEQPPAKRREKIRAAK